MLKKWEFSPNPTEKDPSRWRLKVSISEENLDALMSELPGNKGRPFLVEDGSYDFGIYFYGLGEKEYDAIKSVLLAKNSTEGKFEPYKAQAEISDIFTQLSEKIDESVPAAVSLSAEKKHKEYQSADNHHRKDVDNKDFQTDKIKNQQTRDNSNIQKVPSVLTTNGNHTSSHNEALEESNKYFVEDIPLNPDYTFEQFVVGPNNRFTHAAALAVAKAPGKTYNPFFIHGGVGLGKTHLMQSIGHYVKRTFPDLKVMYITTEKFVADVIDAISRGEGNSLRNFYKMVDVLLVDDIQSLSQSESTQDEFFHIFNLLHQNKKQIVITCDRPPKLLTILEDRLRSRFEWGLIADIKSPSLETRVAILKKKEEMENLSLDDNILLYIASKLKSNVRELEGFLKRITAYSTLTKQEVDITLVKQLMAELLPAEEYPSLTLAQAEQLRKKSTMIDLPPQTIPKDTISLPPQEEIAPTVKKEDIKEGDIQILPKGATFHHTTVPTENTPQITPGKSSSQHITTGVQPAHPSVSSPPAIDPTLKPVDVVFFYPMGHEKELNKVKEKFSEVIKKHKLKFQLVSIFDKPYETEGKLNYAMFTELCKTNKVSISVVLAPPPESGLKEEEFANILGAMMSDEKISMQFVPWNEINKDYRYLNLALDITLSSVSVAGISAAS